MQSWTVLQIEIIYSEIVKEKEKWKFRNICQFWKSEPKEREIGLLKNLQNDGLKKMSADPSESNEHWKLEFSDFIWTNWWNRSVFDICNFWYKSNGHKLRNKLKAQIL